MVVKQLKDFRPVEIAPAGAGRSEWNFHTLLVGAVAFGLARKAD